MSPRRPILACLALLAGGAFLLGCGSSGEEPSISEEDALALESRLDAIQEDADQLDCSGTSTVFTRLTATREQVDASEGINEQAKSDLSELLDELESKIQEECDAAAETSSTTSSSTTDSDEETTDTESTTTSTETETDTTTDKTTTEDTSTTEEPPETTPEPPDPPDPPSGGGTPPSGGGNPSGGVGPGFESGRKVPG